MQWFIFQFYRIGMLEGKISFTAINCYLIFRVMRLIGTRKLFTQIRDSKDIQLNEVQVV